MIAVNTKPVYEPGEWTNRVHFFSSFDQNLLCLIFFQFFTFLLYLNFCRLSWFHGFHNIYLGKMVQNGDRSASFVDRYVILISVILDVIHMTYPSTILHLPSSPIVCVD